MLQVSLLVAFAAVVAFVLWGVRYLANDRVGIVEKRWSASGSIEHGVIALRGEAGFQPYLLRGGLHWLMPLQYKVHRVPLVTIAQGSIGYVFARDGAPLGQTQALGANLVADDFQDAEGFLGKGGQRGPQRRVLREGTYAINLAQFVVLTRERVYSVNLERDEDAIVRRMVATIEARHGFTPVVFEGAADEVGIVTVHEGPSLSQGELIAPIVGDEPNDGARYHNNFQDPERFLAAGGKRGRQLQVLTEGTWYLNCLFATVERIAKTVLEVGTAGVVVSYTGHTGADLSGTDYKHGELVSRGARGVWSEPLLPGKYAFNTYAGKVVAVPTTNFILKWNRREVGAHRFDENLAEVSLITKDAFEPSLPLSVVVHIDYRKAPLVIQRFGDIKRLVEQTLDPMVAAYFKNIGQTRTLIELIQDRSAIQARASEEMKAKFAHYNLELEEVLIGTPTSAGADSHIEMILAQLRQRQIAEEQIETFQQQQKAAVQERALREAVARAERQKALTESELQVDIERNKGRADYQRALEQAAQIRALAEAEADKAARIGVAQAVAVEEQVRAYGGPRFQVVERVMSRFAEAVEKSGAELVPRVMVGSMGDKGVGVIEGLMALMVSEKLGDVEVLPKTEGEGVRLREALRASLAAPPNAGASRGAQ